MFIVNKDGKIINISEFEDIRLEYRKLIGDNRAHFIIGFRSFHRDQPWRFLEEKLAMFSYRQNAEMVYEDLMKSVSGGTETFRILDETEYLKDADDETIMELVEYEKKWIREYNPKPKAYGCLNVIVVLFSIVVSIFFMIKGF